MTVATRTPLRGSASGRAPGREHDAAGTTVASDGASVLVVDDVESNALLAAKALRRHGIDDVRVLTDPRAVIAEIRARRPDLLLLDLHMPDLDGFAVLDLLTREIPGDELLPVIVLTAEHDLHARRRALRSGALDYVTKPFDVAEVVERTRNLLRVRRMHDRERRSAAHFAGLSEARAEALGAMKDELRLLSDELDEQTVDAFLRLARTADLRDDASGAHNERVGRLAGRVARRLGQPEAVAATLELAARLHDVGKSGIPDPILRKPGRLDAAERAQLERHCAIGAELLAGSDAELFQMARRVALTHHERWDGHGYPAGLAGHAIPLEGRIVAVVDAYDSLTHDRPFQRAWSPEAALDRIAREAGRHFDPEVVAALLQDVAAPGGPDARDVRP